MKNCECYDKDGKFLGWFSRSVAVVGIVVLKENDRYYVLASQRGTGTPDKEFIGKWNLCCGYLDFNETAAEAVLSEIKEETGVDLTGKDCRLLYVNSDPKGDKRQNVTLRYGIYLDGGKDMYERQFSHKDNEKDEVGEIRFIDTNDVEKYEWAFNHNNIIRAMLPVIQQQFVESNTLTDILKKRKH